jgi:hypothetical protein
LVELELSDDEDGQVATSLTEDTTPRCWCHRQRVTGSPSLTSVCCAQTQAASHAINGDLRRPITPPRILTRSKIIGDLISYRTIENALRRSSARSR